MQVSIGQGNTLVTPLQNSFLVAAALNDGKLMKPYLVDRVEDTKGNIVSENAPKQAAEPITKKEAKALKKLMRKRSQAERPQLSRDGVMKQAERPVQPSFTMVLPTPMPGCRIW